MQAEYTDGLSKGVFSIFLRRIPLLKKSVLYQWSHTHTHTHTHGLLMQLLRMLFKRVKMHQIHAGIHHIIVLQVSLYNLL